MPFECDNLEGPMTPEDTRDRPLRSLIETILQQQAILIVHITHQEQIERNMLDTMTTMARHLYAIAVATMRAATSDSIDTAIAISEVDAIEAREEGA